MQLLTRSVTAAKGSNSVSQARLTIIGKAAKALWPYPLPWPRLCWPCSYSHVGLAIMTELSRNIKCHKNASPVSLWAMELVGRKGLGKEGNGGWGYSSVG